MFWTRVQERIVHVRKHDMASHVFLLFKQHGLVLQYVSLSLRPLTCEVKLGHRWGAQEQSCMR